MTGTMFLEDYEHEVEVEFERQQYNLLVLSMDFCRDLD